MAATDSIPSADVVKPPAIWLTGKAAAARLGVNVKTLPLLVKRRLLTCRAVPGTPARYLEASVEHLLARSTTIAADPEVEPTA
jgi:hypothetical protein